MTQCRIFFICIMLNIFLFVCIYFTNLQFLIIGNFQLIILYYIIILKTKTVIYRYYIIILYKYINKYSELFIVFYYLFTCKCERIFGDTKMP